MKAGTTIAVVAGGVTLLALLGGGVYLATRNKQASSGADPALLADAAARAAEARAAQAQADAAKAQADAAKAQAKAADRPFLEEAGLAVIDSLGDFFGSGGFGSKLI